MCARPMRTGNTVPMRAVIQRVSSASVAVDGATVGAVGAGLMVLLGVAVGDDQDAADRLARKIARLRIFESSEGKLDLSIVDTGGQALVVSQFTLLADSRRQKGTRPDFSRAARPEIAEPLYLHFCDALREHGIHVETGAFKTYMQVELVNDGPVTIVLDVES